MICLIDSSVHEDAESLNRHLRKLKWTQKNIIPLIVQSLI